MAAPNGSDYELLTEHFSYPPVSLLDDIINTVNVLADRALDSVERLLLSIAPQNLGFKPSKSKDDGDDAKSAEEVAKLEIENGTHQMETLLNAAIDKNFDIFELYIMRNILTIEKKTQPFIRLSHYEGLDLSNHTNIATMGSINQFRRRLHASQKLHVALEAERARNEALLNKLQGVLGSPEAPDERRLIKQEPEAATADEGQGKALKFLRDKGNLEQGGTDKPITTTAEFTLSQLQSLRALSLSLRALLPELGTSETTPESDNAKEKNKPWRRERAEYVESASRKYLERSGGLELGPHGEVRGGEWQGGGPSLTKGEVENLETVASLLGSGTEGRPGGNGVEDAANES
ncbi:hypothetical protein QQS21_007758 [Conoideocrella luteorostrata]|uniref:Centromere protein Mis12 n=1 Tax=Conoideocrella luteorostrata TaxID=1105319 RepID=A0AAJ0FWP1_9HYPO|nr:hypothetical protein QQS21_007758 [Conoideocrella luteorostrata]